MHRSQSTEVRVAVRAALCAALACGASTASADQAETPPPTAAAQPREATRIEEVVVTAQRREQNIQDVGIAVTALDERTMQNLNITTATDIVKAVPNLRMNAYSSAQVVFNIRGVAQNDYGDQQEPPVAVYQDDSYSSTINLASFPVFDLARVETLRGPQGTLFGRNATGGAIQFISNAPTKEFEGYANLTVGSFNQVVAEGAISGPFTDKLQGRLALISNQDDGWMESIVPGVPDRGGNDHYALRGRMAWQPGDSTDVDLIVRYLEANGETQAGLYSHEPACPNDNFQGEFTDPDEICEYWSWNPDVFEGSTGTGFEDDSIIPSRGGDPYKTAETEPSYVDREVFGAQIRLVTDVGAGTLTSITDYQTSDKFYTEGGDASPDDGVYFFQGADLDQISQEFRYAWTAGRHEVVAGLFGMNVDGDYIGKFASRFYGYDPDVSFTQETTSFAAFLQDEWSFAERWKLIAGLRYWDDSREGSYFGNAPAVPGGQPEVTIIFSPEEIFPFTDTVTTSDADQSFDDITARLQLDYRPNDDLLWYVSYNRGSKSGGFSFSTGTPFDPNQIPFLEGIVYEPETLNAYELGMKSNLSGGTMMLNLAAFYYDYEDYQAFAQLGPIQTIVNQDAEAMGLEVELNAQPTDRLYLQLGASFMDSEVKDIALPSGNVADHDMPQAPPISANALARYELPIGNGIASIQGDVYYTDDFCFSALCAPVEQEDSYTVANARIAYGAGDGRWEVAAFVNNLFEEEYRVYAFDSSLFAGVVAGVYAKPQHLRCNGQLPLRRGLRVTRAD